MLLNHYLLAPDTGAARRLRRLLCADTARTGVVVGTWGELLVHACADYLVPMAETQWDAELAAALHALPHAGDHDIGGDVGVVGPPGGRAKPEVPVEAFRLGFSG